MQADIPTEPEEKDEEALSENEEKYVPEMIIAGRHCSGTVVYGVKWQDFPWEHNCEASVEDPAEFLNANGQEMEGRVIEVTYPGSGWEEGRISKYDHDSETKLHDIHFNDGLKALLDLVKSAKPWRLLVDV